jgi:tryptophanyl-tRNA synthetase
MRVAAVGGLALTETDVLDLAWRRRRSAMIAGDPGYVLQVVKRGIARAREITDATLRDVRAALGLFTLN